MFDKLYEYQTDTQQLLVSGGIYDEDIRGYLPSDAPGTCGYHLLHLATEVGEIAHSDLRWKRPEEAEYDPEAKLEEIADSFIELMNVAIFSGFSKEMLFHAISSKMETVRVRAGWAAEDKRKEMERKERENAAE